MNKKWVERGDLSCRLLSGHDHNDTLPVKFEQDPNQSKVLYGIVLVTNLQFFFIFYFLLKNKCFTYLSRPMKSK